jgi:NAD(P)H-quinone oxidoreductase subunit 5
VDRWAGWRERLLFVLVLGLAVASVALFVWKLVEPRPVFVLGVVIDRLSVALGMLVALIGAATYRFSVHCLEGDPGRPAFLARLSATVLAAYALMLANHLVLLLAAWSLTGLGLHLLLTHHADRPEAIRAARKKFLISRLGDLALVAAIVVIVMTWGTFDLTASLQAASRLRPDDQWALHSTGVLVAIAAITKSAQFPFHSWLPETMEAPTPVSALMHAGIINAGGALLLRFAPLIVHVPAALWLLTIIGTITVTLGMPAMWAQVKVKRTLAWSTVGQMGFMIVQCGLGAFPAALLHILGHGFTKAWSFMWTGALGQPAEVSGTDSPGRVLGLMAIGTATALPVLALAARITGFSPWEQPGEMALAAALAISIGQVWVAVWRTARTRATVSQRLGALVAVSFSLGLAAFGLYRAAEIYLDPALAGARVPPGPMAWAMACVPVIAILSLVVLQAILPTISRWKLGQSLYVHALNGFYLGVIADRVVAAVWFGLIWTLRGVRSGGETRGAGTAGGQ